MAEDPRTHKSVDGRAVITDDHLVFEYNFLARTLRGVKREEIPLSEIASYELLTHDTIDYLRVVTPTSSTAVPPNTSRYAFALHPRKPHKEFVATLERLTRASGANRLSPTSKGLHGGYAPRPSGPTAKFGGYTVKNGVLHGKGRAIDIVDATAEATLGSPGRRSTLTRMGAGALIAGPAGFIVGAVARKDTSKCFVTIEAPSGFVVVEGRAKDYADAAAFADAVNRASR